MTPALLIQSLCKFLEGVVENYTLESNIKTLKTPQIVDGFLPPKKGNQPEAEFPYIIVRLVEGEDEKEESTTTIKMLFGTYSEDVQGFHDVLNLMEKVRQALLKKRTIDNKFRMELPYKWEVPEEQPHPEWFGMSISKWIIPKVLEENMNF
ncbi:hypothetical protein [Chengkuizengella axinellae]|uniref:Tail terminator n=1 Tax=Chengkuizengella axinellae TaxID=3064388 RepID=A0ABT9J6B6_9BACL|nr:hypothetical protein [Chengkuizengella sp. 2205SS18-9]MDP5277145.1 hypothetical protein [Chengkuizengella sp. 2205SS18-9]